MKCPAPPARQARHLAVGDQHVEALAVLRHSLPTWAGTPPGTYFFGARLNPSTQSVFRRDKNRRRVVVRLRDHIEPVPGAGAKH